MSKLRKSAKGRECQIRIPGVCNHNSETVVLCHLGGAGMGIKNDDMFAAFGCSCCHNVIDGRLRTNIDYRMYFYDAMVRTQKIWLKEGLITHV